MLYVLPYNSKADLLILRRQSLKKGWPDPLIPINIEGVTLMRYFFIYDRPCILSRYSKKFQSITWLYNCLDLHRLNPQLDIQIMPVSVMFSRTPGREFQHSQFVLRHHLPNGIRKFFSMLWFSRESFMCFSRPLSLRPVIIKHDTDKLLAKKLIRVARIHFIRQRLAVTGPRLPVRQDLFSKLLASKIIKKAIGEEVNRKRISLEKAQKSAIKRMEEITADFSYKAARFADRILGWIWNRLYQELHVHNAAQVRQLAEAGHEIVYVPCHRSHMDYFLLSYVLYHHGLAPPHIAAGDNLSFWPVGWVFRRLGAFFIRRTFKGNKLYSAVFREYLRELFTRGYSVEYFIEGGRSRTGRLLDPKTGILTMTIQAMLRGNTRSITLVPIYFGYEHVIEVETYVKELHGVAKEKERIWQILRGLCKLRNLGHGYINFGAPLFLNRWLSEHVPQWHYPITVHRPIWLAAVADDIAMATMVRINNAAATNAINLCSSVLLAARYFSLTHAQLLSQLTCYLELLRNVPYTSNITVPDLTPDALLTHALAMNKFTIKRDGMGDVIIYLSPDQAILMTYYRNNIQHLLILPALVANIICSYPGIEHEMLHQWIKLIYPFLKAELFMCYSQQQLLPVIDKLIAELIRQGLGEMQKTQIYPSKIRLHALQLLSSSANETLQRYAITFFLMGVNPRINRSTLEKKSRIVAHSLSALQGIRAPEFFDKAIFSFLVATLYTEEYISNSGLVIDEKVREMYNILRILITPDILNNIENASLAVEGEIT